MFPLLKQMWLPGIRHELARYAIPQAAPVEGHRLADRHSSVVFPVQYEDRCVNVLHVPYRTAVSGAGIGGVCFPGQVAGELAFEPGRVGGHTHHVPIGDTGAADGCFEAEVLSGYREVGYKATLGEDSTVSNFVLMKFGASRIRLSIERGINTYYRT